jgi:hypothetical protein
MKFNNDPNHPFIRTPRIDVSFPRRTRSFPIFMIHPLRARIADRARRQPLLLDPLCVEFHHLLGLMAGDRHYLEGSASTSARAVAVVWRKP